MSDGGKGKRTKRRGAKAASEADARSALWSAGIPLAAVAVAVLLGAALQTGPDATEPAAAFEPEPDASMAVEPIVEPVDPAAQVAEPDTFFDEPTEQRPPPETQPEPVATIERPEPTRPAAKPTPKPATPSDLDQRARQDLQRLTDAGGWTLQFVVACNANNVRTLLRAAGDDPNWFVLPRTLDDKNCYRVCWGSYPSRGQAVAQMEFPAALGSITRSPLPLSSEELR